MNFIKYISFFLVSFFLFLQSCTLEVKPPSTIVNETFWRNETDANQYLNNIYAQLAPSVNIYADAYTEDAYAQYPWESTGSLFQQNQLDAASASGWSFQGIAAVNEFLANVDKCVMDADLKERMKAEARAFRAIDYLNKTLSFGKVPLITTVLDPRIKEVPRDEISKVRQFIYEELEASAAILPTSYSNSGSYNEKGRITSYAAYAFLARAALYFGDYGYAETTALKLMDGTYSLFKIDNLSTNQLLETTELENYIDFDLLGIDRDTFFKGLFSYESLWHDQNANPNNPEYVFSREFADNLSSNETDWARYLALRPSQLGGWSSICATQNLIDAYWTVDGKNPTIPSVASRKEYYEKALADYKTISESNSISFIEYCKSINDDKSIKDIDFLKEFRNRDSRLYASILFPFKGWFETEFGTDFYYQWIKNGNNESKTGYNFRKITPLTKTSTGSEESTADYPSFRYAEVLLIYAEARTQNTGYDSQVENALNLIRSRAGMPNVPSSFASKEEALELIRAERRIELACEGLRADDQTRYPSDYWESAMNNVSLITPEGETIIEMKWDERMRLRPIPQTAIDKNAALQGDQNLGYN